MICALWIVLTFTAIYIWLMGKQIRFVHSARDTADRPIPEDNGGSIILVLSYLSILSVSINVLLVLCAKRQAIVVNKL